MAKKTRIIVQAETNVPIYLRGEGLSGLSWEKGVKLKHLSSDEWLFETELSFTSGEFKVLVNDQTFELGDNHPLYPGGSIRINPKFPD